VVGWPGGWRDKRTELFTGTVPANKNYVTGTVHANKNYVTGTVKNGYVPKKYT
jgi:hypothetical protein